MSVRRAGFVVSGEVVIVVAADIPDIDAEPIEIIYDHTWRLQQGDRGAAYHVLYQQCANYLRENGIDEAVVKASAINTGPIKKAHLESAEVRGVIISAAASVRPLRIVAKAVISRTYGDRKVDEYLRDDDFWNEQTKGARLRAGSREAAMLLVATRNIE